MKQVIFINKKEHLPFLYKVIQQENKVVVAWTKEVNALLTEQGIQCITTEAYYNYDMGARWMKQLGKKISHVFKYDNLSLWHLMENWLYSSYIYEDSFENVIGTFYKIYNLLNNVKASGVVYIRDNSLMSKMLDILVNELPLTYIRFDHRKRSIKHELKKGIKLELIKSFFPLKAFQRKLMWNLMTKVYTIKNPGKNSILFIYPNHIRNQDYLEPLISNFDNVTAVDISPIDLDLFPLNIFKYKLKDKHINHILLENYLKRKDMSKIENAFDKLEHRYLLASKSKSFQDSFSVNGINLWDLLEPQLSCYFEIRLKQHIKDYVAINNVIKQIKPQVCIMPVETSDFSRGLFHSCKQSKIPSISLQHGVFFDDIRMYHNGDEPIPTKTCVYGKKHKDYLIKKGYPTNSVVITGNQRYDSFKDYIPSIAKVLHNKKIVVLATQPFALESDRHLLIKTVGKAVNKLGHFLVITVHPNLTKTYIEQLCEKYKVDALVTDYDFKWVLSTSDLFIFCDSTGLLEAALLNKGSISVRKLLDGTNYTSYDGLSVEPNNIKELTNYIKTMIGKPKYYGKALEGYCYKNDGKATERIIEVIKNV